MSIVITGATGKLGQQVVEQLLHKAVKDITVVVRTPANAAAWAKRGVRVVQGDYASPKNLESAFKNADKLLFISSNDMENRKAQHAQVVHAAKSAGVKWLAYTSIVHANTSKMHLAHEHRDTEQHIEASGIPYVFLRNSWYIENHTDNLASALQFGAIAGAVGEGRIAGATRADYAAAAVAVLTGQHTNVIYELGGDKPYTLGELAATVTRLSGKTVAYNNMPEAAYKDMLMQVGLPAPLAKILSDSEAHAARGDLDDRSGTLSRLIGRPTTPLEVAVKAGLENLRPQAH